MALTMGNLYINEGKVSGTGINFWFKITTTAQIKMLIIITNLKIVLSFCLLNNSFVCIIFSVNVVVSSLKTYNYRSI
jgi:hypothetical protein